MSFAEHVIILRNELNQLNAKEEVFTNADLAINEFIQNKATFTVSTEKGQVTKKFSLMDDRAEFESRLNTYQRAAITVEGIIDIIRGREGVPIGKQPSTLLALSLYHYLLIIVGLLVVFGLSFKTSLSSASYTYPNGTIVMTTTPTPQIPTNVTLLFVGLAMVIPFLPYIQSQLRKKEEQGKESEVTEALARVRKMYLGAFMLSSVQPQNPELLSYYRKIFPAFATDRKKFCEVTLPSMIQNEIGRVTNHVSSQIWACRAFLISRLTGAGQQMPQASPQQQ